MQPIAAGAVLDSDNERTATQHQHAFFDVCVELCPFVCDMTLSSKSKRPWCYARRAPSASVKKDRNVPSATASITATRSVLVQLN
jgi:hypothetical protein